MTDKSIISEDDIHAYVDGTLPADARERVERAMARDPALAAKINDYFSLNAALHERYDRTLAEPIPKRLRPDVIGRRRTAVNRPHWPRYAGLAAALLVGIGIGMGAGMQIGRTQFGQPGSGSGTRTVSVDTADAFARNAAIAHVVYMPAVDRPTELGAKHEQDFVQWLSNKLGTDIHPPVLSHSGYELTGGRLLHDAHGTMALFMYRDAQGKRVTLCISRRTLSPNTTAFKLYRDGPVNVFYWVDGAFGYAVSSGIDRDALLALAHDVQQQLTGAAPG
ncbi:anti-sigma factor [Trinickia sp. EG282A]|uniref:anti-sigma factor n=1 Tax=Trinickia sp. EG282A TaxID=3237013 RepID=UPI0034D1A815